MALADIAAATPRDTRAAVDMEVVLEMDAVLRETLNLVLTMATLEVEMVEGMDLVPRDIRAAALATDLAPREAPNLDLMMDTLEVATEAVMAVETAVDRANTTTTNRLCAKPTFSSMECSASRASATHLWTALISRATYKPPAPP